MRWDGMGWEWMAHVLVVEGVDHCDEAAELIDFVEGELRHLR